jgi:serine/tyrosine/threonine adenylyltransferase
MQMNKITEKIYQNRFVETFPGDGSGDLTPRQTPGMLYSRVAPTPVKAPELIAWSEELAEELGISRPASPEEVAVLAGNKVTESMAPYSACYAGHQFGNWAGQLGDGRAITLGEWEMAPGKSRELQLKGAGLTPYSRGADGRAVLRSSVREYLMSEAMYHLGIPTTRALSLVGTGEDVLRDMFYNGNAAYEPGAVVMRVAPSFLRFGSFEMPAARKETGNLRKLVDWTIDNYYPHLQGEDRVIRWYAEVQEKTAALVVEWMRVGFVHGVMNTDNMSILGLTIDYGPYSFMDDYDPSFTPNTTDLPGRRYAFGNQAAVAHWNLMCLANALVPLFENTSALENELNKFRGIYEEKYGQMMADKLGLDRVREGDKELIGQLEKMLAAVGPDMTMFYQLLMDLPEDEFSDEGMYAHFKESFYEEPSPEAFVALMDFLGNYRLRLGQNACSREDSREKMRQANPRFVLRNYLLHQAIEGLEKGDDSLFRELELAIKEPYTRNFDRFFAKRPDWASKKAGCSMLSCSS